jgi:antibiotic biosynthesis monooxygenase (ABM) superfamily enzyme
MIKRIWRGWTEPEHADAYEALLNKTIVPGITARNIAGHQSTVIFRRLDPDTDEVEFMTVMSFDDWAAVEAFAGGDARASVVPDSARQFLKRFDEHSTHYEQRSEH